jgi:hypothetical protein
MLSTILKASASKTPKELTFLNSAQSNTSGSTFTFSTLDLGTPTADRRIIVGMTTANNTRTFNSVTVGGVTATINLQYRQNLIFGGSDNNTVAIATAHVPNGTTGDIVVSLSGSNPNLVIGWWRATGLTSDNHYDSFVSSLGSNPQTVNINGLEGGFFVTVAGSSGTGSAVTYTGATKRYEYRTNRAGSGADAVTVDGTNTYSLSYAYSNDNRGWIGLTF